MIYSTNRTSSLGEQSIDVNESYFGIGAQSFYQESAQDELSIFETAIKSDIDEVLIGESASELQALNEGFVANVVKKVKEMMKKFKEWIMAVMRSAFAKLSSLIVRDNATFAKTARKHIATMKNKDKFKYSGKVVTNVDVITSTCTAITNDGDKAIKAISVDTIDPSSVDAKIKDLDDTAAVTAEELVDACTKEVRDEGISVVDSQLKALDSLSKKTIKDLKKAFNDSIKSANEVIKKFDKMEGKDDAEKEKINACAKLATAYKTSTQKCLSTLMSVLKTLAKIARKVVAKAMGATPKNEGVEYDEELNNALIESAEYEYDEALEEMSEGCHKEDCDEEHEDEE